MSAVDYPDYGILASKGAITEQESGFSKPFNFWQEKALGPYGTGDVTFTVSDNDYVYVPKSLYVSPMTENGFVVTVYINGVEYFYSACQNYRNIDFSGLAGMQLVDGGVVLIHIYNIGGYDRTYKVAFNGVKILKPEGY